MKPNPRRRDLDIYPHQFNISTRFADLDPQHHLNNVRLAEFYQEARIAMFRRINKDFGFQRPHGTRTLVAHQSLDYVGEVQHPGDVTMGVGVTRIGTSSWGVGMGMFQYGKCVGLSDAVLVFANSEGSTPLPDDLRHVLEQFLVPEDARS